MGDYQTQYVLNPSFSLAHAVAASAAVPGVIGPLRILSDGFSWRQFVADSKGMVPVQPLFSKYYLWDGGVYDNLGIEALYKPQGGLREGIDFLMVSDASKPLGQVSRSWKDTFCPSRRFIRLVDIATEQVRALRARMIVSHFMQNPLAGVYLRMGNTMSEIYQRANKPYSSQRQLSIEEVMKASSMETTLRCLATEEFDVLYRHGFEVADATLCAYQENRFSQIVFSSVA